MLPKAERLRRRRDFQTVLRTGRRMHHPLVTLYFLPRAAGGRLAAFVVGRRVSNKAARRNKVRRRLREAYRLRRHQVKSDVWLIFAAQPAAGKANFHQLAAAVEQLLRQAGLWADRDNMTSEQRDH
ncbi:MAG: ribonuclease P protein component [Abditibacteriales bacterium]|nr:ribonuclease P protein component [Abditibacteriales bacterium]MDW8366116.1 ribonuclease P protein component [Abditibacteriales bacterium]